MPTELKRLVDRINPSKTVLFFGSGSSVPSGLKTAPALATAMCDKFGLGDGYSLTEAAQIVENREGRPALISFLKSEIAGAKPSGGIQNLPLYPWNGIFTTNYDQIVEQSFSGRSVPLRVISSNFDFGSGRDDESIKLYKLHGSIENDVVSGSNSRIIISEADYDLTEEYREMLWDRLKVDIADNDCIIIGYSLADAHIREAISKIAELKQKSGHATKIYLLLYTVDLNRSSLYERRGIEVCFAGIDEFFVELAVRQSGARNSVASPDSALGNLNGLYPVTTVVADAIQRQTTIDRMYNGWPASWADVDTGHTFLRDQSVLAASRLAAFEQMFAIFLGASGTGKTTAARQAVLELANVGYLAWEHNSDRQLLVKEWCEVARKLQQDESFGVLMIDDAHDHLYEINQIAETLVSEKLTNFQMLLTAPRHDWYPRVKSPSLYKYGEEYVFSKLSDSEIDKLIFLVENNPSVRKLVESSFSGFSKSEKRRRLQKACDKNTFVCLKNIFDNDAFDDIILREFASLENNLQEIYRIVCALESLNVKVHRQLVIRLTGIPAASITAALDGLTDIVEEYSIDEREGVFGWRGRHHVITGIIAKYKFNEQGAIYKLLEKTIEALSMTYDIEVRTVRNLCSASGGITKAGNKQQQINLLQKLISQAPGQRVPRHRLIANLISMGETSKAETEIKLFEHDFREDGPVARYRVKLLLYRALKGPGILEEDRKAILTDAITLARKNVKRFPANKHVLTSYCDTGLASLKLTGSFEVFDAAMKLLKDAESKLGDPDISKQIERYSRAVASQEHDDSEFGLSDEAVD